jgi:hypothetical protein
MEKPGDAHRSAVNGLRRPEQAVRSSGNAESVDASPVPERRGPCSGLRLTLRVTIAFAMTCLDPFRIRSRCPAIKLPVLWQKTISQSLLILLGSQIVAAMNLSGPSFLSQK